MGKIIDISHHQNPDKINYDKLSKEVDHVIIRTQYGSKTIDRYYKTHHREFKRRGVATSAYPCDLHQYTSKGRLTGYDGNLDLNRIISNFKFVENNTYIVQPGDTLSEIALRNHVRVGDIVRANNIKDPNRIYVGDKLMIPNS